MDAKTAGFPDCDSDCFASKDGKCICLSENDFGYSCPFYQPESDEVNTDVIERAVRSYKPIRREVGSWQPAL